MKYSVLHSGLVQSGLSEDKMSLAPVWLWGGSSSLARKTALTEASVCVIVGLQEERGNGGERKERDKERMQKERVRRIWRG